MDNLKKLTEGELISFIQKGDDVAFQELYDRYHKLVYYVAFNMCRNDADAQDVLQESFLEIRRSIKDLQKPSYFRLWLYRIVNTKCKKLFRKNKFDLTTLDRDDVEYTFLVERKEHTPKTDMRFSSDYDVLHQFIDELPPIQRFTIILFYMEQFTSAEIAQICEVSEGTVKSRLFTARNNLKKKVMEYEEREGVALNFHDLSTILYTAFGFTLTKLANATPSAVIGTLKKPEISAHSNSTAGFFQANAFAVKVMAVACGSVLAIGGGYFTYQQSKQNNPTIMERALDSSIFPTITYRNETITNSKDAYYALKTSYCKQDLDEITEAEKQEILQVYQALKNENGGYYQELLRTNWAQTFENIK